MILYRRFPEVTEDFHENIQSVLPINGPNVRPTGGLS